MIDFIQNQFTNIISKCLDKQAKENSVPKDRVALVFKLDDRNEVNYLIYKNYSLHKVMSFLEVLGVKIDLKGYSLFVPAFIKGALNRFSEQESIPKSDVNVMTFFESNSKMILAMYNKNVFVKYVEFESLFNEKDIAEITM